MLFQALFYRELANIWVTTRLTLTSCLENWIGDWGEVRLRFGHTRKLSGKKTHQSFVRLPFQMYPLLSPYHFKRGKGTAGHNSELFRGSESSTLSCCCFLGTVVVAMMDSTLQYSHMASGPVTFHGGSGARDLLPLPWGHWQSWLQREERESPKRYKMPKFQVQCIIF